MTLRSQAPTALELLVRSKHELERVQHVLARLGPSPAFADRGGDLDDLSGYPAIASVRVANGQPHLTPALGDLRRRSA